MISSLIHLLQRSSWILLSCEKISLYLDWRKHILQQLNRKVFCHILQLHRRKCDSCAEKRAIERRNDDKIVDTLDENERINERELVDAELKNDRFLSKKIIDMLLLLLLLLLLSENFFTESSNKSWRVVIEKVHASEELEDLRTCDYDKFNFNIYTIWLN